MYKIRLTLKSGKKFISGKTFKTIEEAEEHKQYTIKIFEYCDVKKVEIVEVKKSIKNESKNNRKSVSK